MFRKKPYYLNYPWWYPRQLIGRILLLGGFALLLYGGVDWYQQATLGQSAKPLPQVNATPEKVGEEAIRIALSQVRVSEEDSGVVWQHLPKKGERFADLEIPALKVRLPVVEGTGVKELRKGVGHYATSVFPGEPDNSVLAGHRESALGKIGKLKKGDEIVVKTKHEGTFTYEVTKHWITDENDRSVIVSHESSKLTVITCYPFNAIGSPERYIVQADLVDVQK
ncbi:sortase [Kroppenstedtia eburnea]|nr:sortase [Kroppenstedtia guangzhouensis]EGK10225.1 LPXTG-site transpeptidase [Desmospora sp. 8437]